MAVEVGALRAMLSLDSAAFGKGIKRAQAQMSGFQRNMDKASRKLQSVGRTMSTRVTAPIVASLGFMARSSVRSAAEIERLSQAANANTTEFQRFAAGARDVGIQQDKLADILKDTNDRVGDFLTTGGGPMADFFENIAPKVGVTAEEFAKLSGPEALQLYVSSLEKAGVSQQEMTFYMEALASDATLLLPLLRNNGAEMDRLADSAENAGAVMKAETITALNNSRDAMRDAGDAAKGLSQQFMAALAPAFERIAEIAQGLAEWFSGLSPQVKTVTATVAGLVAALGPLALAIGGVSSAISVLMGAVKLAIPAVVALGGPLTIIAAVIGTVAAGMVLFGDKTKVATPHLDAAAKAQKALNVALGTFSDTAAPSAAAEAINLANDMAQEAKKAMDAAKAQIALAEARQAALASSTDTARTQGLRQRADEQAAQARERLAAAEDALAEAERARDRVAREVTGGPLALPSVQVEGGNASDTIRNLGDVTNEVFGSGGSATSAVARGSSAIKSDLEGIGDQASGVADRFGSMVAGLITGSQKIGDVLSRLSERLLASAFSNLGSSMGMGQSGQGLLGMGNFLGFLDKGGMVPSGKFAIAGERGPEIVTGPAQVTSRRKTADLMSGEKNSRVEIVLSPDLEARLLEKSANQSVEISMGVSQQMAREQQRNIGGAVKTSNMRGT